MEGFTYHNIFETKGIEYLIIIGFFAILIPFWLLLNRKVKIRQYLHSALGVLTVQALRIPQGIFFNRFHAWTHLEPSGNAKVGLDDFILQLTGDVQIHPLKKPGDTIAKGECLAEINHKGKILKISSPVTGEILDINDGLRENPSLLSSDPYEEGWLYLMKPSSWVADTSPYFLAENATNWFRQELERFKGFLAGSVHRNVSDPSNVVLQDGGELICQPLAELPDEVWKEFQKEFLG